MYGSFQYCRRERLGLRQYLTAKGIENAVKAKGLELDRKMMHMPEAIKALGSYSIPVKLLTDVTATLKVEVVKK